MKWNTLLRGKYIPWWLFGKRRKEAANALLKDWRIYDPDEKVRIAMRAGADPNIKSTFGHSFIDYALDGGKLEAAKLFINAGATIDQETAMRAYLVVTEPDEFDPNNTKKDVALLINDESKRTSIYEAVVKKRIQEIEEQKREEEARRQEKEEQRRKSEERRKKIQELEQAVQKYNEHLPKSLEKSVNVESDRTTACDFCDKEVAKDETAVGLIKGAQFLVEFEEVIGKKINKPPSHFDPKSGEPMYFACPMCLLKYHGICTKCGSHENVIEFILRGEDTGLEVPAFWCAKCMAESMLSGGSSFGGYRPK